MILYRNRKLPKVFATVLVLTMLAFGPMLFASPTSAQTSTISFPTGAFVAASPNPVAVNQQVTIYMWLIEINPTASGMGGGRWGNYSLQITAPDGNTQTRGPFTADDASFAYTLFTPTQLGNYTLKFSFPGQTVSGYYTFNALVPINAYYQPATFTTTLAVVEQPATASPQTPIPTGYWQRPINAQNQQWYTISGNWLGIAGPDSTGPAGEIHSAVFNPYTQAPTSAHIVWTKSLTFGGLIGGEAGGTTTSNYYTGKSYENMFTPPITINGVLYYNSPVPPRFGWYAVDLRTGQTLYYQNSTGQLRVTGTTQGYWMYPDISIGQVYSFKSPNEEGGRPYVWYTGSTPWLMYDASTGNLILSVANATAGTTIEGPNGELLVYVLNGAKNWLAMWNSSKCVGTLADSFPVVDPTTGVITGVWCFRPPTGATLDWNRGVQWNVTLPSNWKVNNAPTQTITGIDNGVILSIAQPPVGSQPETWQMEIGYDMNTGQQLWYQNHTMPIPTTQFNLMGPIENGVYTEFTKETMQWYGYDLHSGNKLWGPTTPYTNAWDSESLTNTGAYGILFAHSLEGIHAFNITTGQSLWTFNADPSGLDFPGYSTYPFLGANLEYAGGGMLFASTGASHGDPLFRGAELYAVNATSGTKVWDINFFLPNFGSMIIADGSVVAQNGYDNLLYCFSKGKTTTTVTAPPMTTPQGNSVLIQGTVTDQSPGTTCFGTPAAGTPAMSDNSMKGWMEYLYMQQPKPTSATGVPVHLTAIDPNGNFQDIGNAVSDDLGNYAISWTPPVPGMYTVRATFAGSNSYSSSQAGTSFVVSRASAATPSVIVTPVPTQAPTAVVVPTQAPTATIAPTPSAVVIPPTSGAPTATYIAIGVAVIAIIAIASALILKRRK